MQSKLLEELERLNGILLLTSNCPLCLKEDDKGSRYLILDIPTKLDGKNYDTLGIMICCNTLEIDQKKLLQNLNYMISEFNMEKL